MKPIGYHSPPQLKQLIQHTNSQPGSKSLKKSILKETDLISINTQRNEREKQTLINTIATNKHIIEQLSTKIHNQKEKEVDIDELMLTISELEKKNSELRKKNKNLEEIASIENENESKIDKDINDDENIKESNDHQSQESGISECERNIFKRSQDENEKHIISKVNINGQKEEEKSQLDIKEIGNANGSKISKQEDNENYNFKEEQENEFHSNNEMQASKSEVDIQENKNESLNEENKNIKQFDMDNNENRVEKQDIEIEIENQSNQNETENQEIESKNIYYSTNQLESPANVFENSKNHVEALVKEKSLEISIHLPSQSQNSNVDSDTKDSSISESNEISQKPIDPFLSNKKQFNETSRIEYKENSNSANTNKITSYDAHSYSINFEPDSIDSNSNQSIKNCNDSDNLSIVNKSINANDTISDRKSDRSTINNKKESSKDASDIESENFGSSLSINASNTINNDNTSTINKSIDAHDININDDNVILAENVNKSSKSSIDNKKDNESFDSILSKDFNSTINDDNISTVKISENDNKNDKSSTDNKKENEIYNSNNSINTRIAIDNERILAVNKSIGANDIHNSDNNVILTDNDSKGEIKYRFIQNDSNHSDHNNKSNEKNKNIKIKAGVNNIKENNKNMNSVDENDNLCTNKNYDMNEVNFNKKSNSNSIVHNSNDLRSNIKLVVLIIIMITLIIIAILLFFIFNRIKMLSDLLMQKEYR